MIYRKRDLSAYEACFQGDGTLELQRSGFFVEGEKYIGWTANILMNT